jgi:hypothetical protein
MKIYMPSATLRAARAAARAEAAKTAKRSWHPKRVLFARLGDEDVRLFEVVERRLTPSNGWEYRAINHLSPATLAGEGATGG